MEADKDLQQLVYDEIEEHLTTGQMPPDVADKLRAMSGWELMEAYDFVQKQMQERKKVTLEGFVPNSNRNAQHSARNDRVFGNQSHGKGLVLKIIVFVIIVTVVVAYMQLF